MLIRRNIFLLIIIFSLCIVITGCGFRPLYSSASKDSLSQSFNVSIKGHNKLAPVHYKLRRELDVLLPTLERVCETPVKLRITVADEFGDIALNERSKIMRSQGHMTATVDMDWILINSNQQAISKHEQFFEESVTSFTAKDVEEFSIMSSEKAARDRMVTDLARQIVAGVRRVLVQ